MTMTRHIASSLLAIAITLPLLTIACGGARINAGTPNSASMNATDDQTITARVKTVLLNDPQISATRIDVATTNGVVTISGTVKSKAEEQRAIQLARQVGGVKDVRSTLTIPSILIRARGTPSSCSSFVVCSTSVGGPQMKQSVAASCTSGWSAPGPIRPRPPVHDSSPPVRVIVCCSSIRSVARERPKLLFIREVVGCLALVEEPDLAVRQDERVMQHGAQRRDAGAAGDEDEPPLRRLRRKREGADRTLHVHERPHRERHV